MNENYTDITVLLDRSGSMQSIRDDTIGGFNSFLKDQNGESVLSLAQFDHEFDEVYTARKVKEAPFLTTDTFQPRGTTALLDALGRLINQTGQRLSDMPEAARPSKVIFVIITDGLENASHEFTRDKIFQMIRHQTDVYQWDFVYLGANQDAIQAGASIGIQAGSSLTYTANSVGTAHAFRSASRYVKRAQAGSGTQFDDSDRQAQADVSS